MKLDLAPTKSNLLVVQETLALAKEGHELLSQKREVLLGELLHLVDDVKRVRREAEEALRRAYAALKLVLAHEGSDGAARYTAAYRDRADVSIQERSVMGVPIPLLSTKFPPHQPAWGLGESSAMLDEMVERFREALVRLNERAEVETTVWRLARELTKLHLRTNALEHLVIPQHEETAKFIQETMEEREREAYFQLKRIKARRAAEASG